LIALSVEGGHPWCIHAGEINSAFAKTVHCKDHVSRRGAPPVMRRHAASWVARRAGCVLVQAARCSRLEIFRLEGSRLRHYLGVFAAFQIGEISKPSHKT
jgi:hypothetical protein